MSKKVSRFTILGCGHSGTTLISGIFQISGYRSLGTQTKTFESILLNNLNNIIIHIKNIKLFLNMLEEKTNGKWAIKDPLLSFNISKLYPEIEETVKVIYIYRKPGETVNHLLKGIDKKLNISDENKKELAESIWIKSNVSILNFIKKNNIAYLMMNYDDLVDGKLFNIINRFVENDMNYEFINPSKRKSKSINVSIKLVDLYNKLNGLSVDNHKYILSNSEKIKCGNRIIKKIKYALFMMKFKFQRFNIPLSKINVPYIRYPYPEFNDFLAELSEIEL